MSPSEVKSYVNDLPYMSLDHGEYIYKFIRNNNLRDCLELGFYHGVSSLYIAGAIQDMGSGFLTTIDLKRAETLCPNIQGLLGSSGLAEFVKYYYEPSSYTWRMMYMLNDGMTNKFDFCYIDGGHTWDVTGFAFFLVSRLLKPGGWILFDDLNWSMEKSRACSVSKKGVVPDDEYKARQVGLVYNLLVKTDQNFCDFFTPKEFPYWAFARKKI